MSNLVLEPVYQPGDVVTIKALERVGHVSLIRYDGHVVEFFVVWWDEGKRLSEWLSAYEIADAPGGRPLRLRGLK